MTESGLSTPSAQYSCTRVRVPGKVILSGEHAVVYGTPALACAIQKYAFATVTKANFVGVHLKFLGFDIDQRFSYSNLVDIAQQIQSRHHRYVAGTAPLSAVVSNPVEFFTAALGASGLPYLLGNSFDKQSGLIIELSMDLVAGGGMGSSAALVAAMLAAVFKHIGAPLTDAELIAKTTQSEHWQHGRSSGLDPYVCVMGGVQQYQQGTGTSMAFEPKAFKQCFLITTGRPASSTGECVEAVKKSNFPATLWHQFSTVQQDLLKAIQAENSALMVNAIAANHKLLQHIGVVPEAVANFVANVESSDAAAKVCGAGSIVGDNGGLVLVTGFQFDQLKRLCQQYNYTFQQMIPDMQGVSYLDEL